MPELRRLADPCNTVTADLSGRSVTASEPQQIQFIPFIQSATHEKDSMRQTLLQPDRTEWREV
jgi:hypothetical protein